MWHEIFARGFIFALCDFLCILRELIFAIRSKRLVFLAWELLFGDVPEQVIIVFIEYVQRNNK